MKMIRIVKNKYKIMFRGICFLEWFSYFFWVSSCFWKEIEEDRGRIVCMRFYF